ncbi:MAG: autotransporter outer membrane beta-barrel domain-containing protein, partial [Pseudomonadota bacterium]
EVLIIENGGAIDTSAIAETAVRASGTDQTILNEGVVVGGNEGIRSSGNNVEITNSGITQGDTNGIRADGENATVTNSGSIVSLSQHSIRISNRDVTINNSGSLDAAIHGIRSLGENAALFNSGDISAGTNGIFAFSPGARIENTGNIQAGNDGIRALLGQATIVNEGTISTAVGDGIRTGGSASQITNNLSIQAQLNGIRSDGADAIVDNAGSVDAATLHGIRSSGASATINNSGTVSGAVHGVRVSSGQTILTNTGTIAGSSSGIAIFDAQDVTVINAGEVSGDNFAIFVDDSASNTSIELREGSRTTGLAQFGSNGKLTVDRGMNLALTFEGDAPEVISRDPYAVDTSNRVIYTVDPTGFALAGSYLQTTAGAVHDATFRSYRRSASAQGGSADAMKASPSSQPNKRLWLNTLGGYLSLDGGGDNASADQAYGGLIGGMGVETAERHFGGFFGASYSRQETDNDVQEIDTGSLFAGFYAIHHFGRYWLNTSGLIGYARFSSERSVTSNTDARGVETASADYNGFFLSPSVSLGTAIGQRTQISVGGYYSGLFMESYSESGSSANLHVSKRDVHAASLRANLDYRIYEREGDNSLLAVDFWGGIDGLFNLGGDGVNAKVNDSPLNFSASFNDSTTVGFIGIGIDRVASDQGWNIGGSIEGRYGTHGYREARINIRATKRF